MSQLIDESTEVRMPSCNGRCFVLTEIAAIHDMPQKHLPILPAVLTIFSFKDKPSFHSHTSISPLCLSIPSEFALESKLSSLS